MWRWRRERGGAQAPGGPDQDRRAAALRRRDSIIQARPRAGRAHRVLISLAFAAIGAPILMSSAWLADSVEPSAAAPAPVTVRLPIFFGRAADEPAARGIAVARGEVADPVAVARARELQPSGWGAAAAYLAALFLIALIYTDHLRRSHKGRLLRVQAALLGLQLAVAAAASAALLTTALPAVALPAALLAVCTAIMIDVGAALGTAVVAALLLGGLTPFDPGVTTVLVVQGVCAALVLGDPRRRRRVGRLRLLAAGAVAGGAAALTYLLIYYLSWRELPLAELGSPLHSGWVMSGAAGLVAAVVAIPCLAPFQRLIGDITLGTLIELEDLSQPLLEQIAESSPGTWQHSLAMANMAQIAANAIGADGRLIRVGAYYHDLGKSLQPKYFIENLSGGEASPHDALPPPVSCDAIFAHVTEGVRVARRHGLHERVIDFMHMHHGDGLLEYFWVKCQEQGNPGRLSEADFRYPGVKPDSRETAILAICDAVEAASRTLRSPDATAIEGLVQRIVYGKLHLGQLDDSGLTVADLRMISNSLMETIKHAHHGRIEYPWQRTSSSGKQAAAAAAAAAVASDENDDRDERDERDDSTPSGRPPGAAGDAEVVDRFSATQRLLREPRLDSLDAPRPTVRGRVTARGSRRIENAATEPIGSEPGPTVALVRPPTAAEVAAATSPGMTPPAGSGAFPAAISVARRMSIGASAALDSASTLPMDHPGASTAGPGPARAGSNVDPEPGAKRADSEARDAGETARADEPGEPARPDESSHARRAPRTDGAGRS